ncbi:four helix bundle protein [Tenacibaculum sp. M341]|uniref:four helix bundle protein n=1 Tax=Tenacibaculum sp. M341 TaxID=2530339 RepID=UPI00104F4B84|nr:four helix bundle protein [Tenacibaculum sp. M341]TCI85102.1 four helix bundle protein [Tenacibaculum sp. M341]
MKLENNPLQNKSYDFALQVVKLCKNLMKNQKEFVLSKQLLRSGTSVGANIIEANGAISRADFSSKISIAYKECLETKYWLSLLKDSNDLKEDNFKFLFDKADEIAKILFSILKKTRINKYN